MCTIERNVPYPVSVNRTAHSMPSLAMPFSYPYGRQKHPQILQFVRPCTQPAKEANASPYPTIQKQTHPYQNASLTQPTTCARKEHDHHPQPVSLASANYGDVHADCLFVLVGIFLVALAKPERIDMEGMFTNCELAGTNFNFTHFRVENGILFTSTYCNRCLPRQRVRFDSIHRFNERSLNV